MKHKLFAVSIAGAFALTASASDTTSYVTDGLVAMWDAIENAGPGQPHDNAATTWVNCVDASKYAMTWHAATGKAVWTDDAAIFSRSQAAGNGWWTTVFSYAAEMGREWTIEAVVTPTADYRDNYAGICGNSEGKDRYFPTFGQYENGYSCYRVFLRQEPGTIELAPTDFSVDCAQTFGYSDSPTTAEVWVDGELKGCVANGSEINSTLSESGDFRIGAGDVANDRVFDGRIHCVRIYRRVLTEAERRQNLLTDKRRFGGLLNEDVLSVTGDPWNVPAEVLSPAYGEYEGYAKGDAVTCVAPPDAVSVRYDVVTTNAQIVGYEVYTNVLGTWDFALMKKGKRSSCTFAYPGVATRFVWIWELSSFTNTDVSVKDYVTNGLVAMWDAENNAGFGQHDPEASVWKNLVDPTKLSLTWGGVSGGVPRWTETAASFINSHDPRVAAGVRDGYGSFGIVDRALYVGMGTDWTVEASVRPTQYYFKNYAGICGSDGNAPYICQYENQNLVTRVYNGNGTRSPSGVSVSEAGFRADALLTVSFLDTPKDMWFYTNGCLCATDVNASEQNSTIAGSEFRIGTGSNGSERLFDGDIHCVRTYSRTLSADEVARNSLIDRVRFDGYAGARSVDGRLECFTRVQAIGPVQVSVNGGAPVTFFETWAEYASRTVSIAVQTEAPRCVWRGLEGGVFAENVLTVTTANPLDVLVDAYDPSAANQLVVDVTPTAGTTNSVVKSSLAGGQRIHVGAVADGAGVAELMIGGKVRIVVKGEGYAVVESNGSTLSGAKIKLFRGARLEVLDDVDVEDLVLFNNSLIELNGHSLRYHSMNHRNRAGWDPEAKVVDSVGGGIFGYERKKMGLLISIR